MKKSFLVIVCFMAFVIVGAQSLEDIVSKYTTANKLDKITGLKTIKITGTVSMMGMDLPMVLWMKNPDKIKTVTSFNGQDMVQAYDGEKGYMINPMAGSADAVDMTADQIRDIAKSNIFQNYMANYLKAGQLTLAGEDNVNGQPAFKLLAKLDGGTSATLFIDKISYLLIKTSDDVNQGGMSMTVESVPSDYKETDGVFLAMKTIASANGMEFVKTFTKVEVDTPMEDSIFKIK